MHQVLYVSTLAARALSSVRDIIRSSRKNNPAAGITGILVFDGERFCQYLEGPAETVKALVLRIGGDARHTAMSILYEGALAGPRLFGRWQTAYCLVGGGVQPLATLAGATGPAALTRFLALLPALDQEPRFLGLS